MAEIERSHGNVRVRINFSRTIKQGWADDTTVEVDMPVGEAWDYELRQAILFARQIAESEVAIRNARDGYPKEAFE